MQTRYIIVDSDDVPVGDPDTGATTKYKSFRVAEKAAKECAEREPGRSYFIYELVAETRVPGGEAETFRKYSIEHYK